jgi:hypothetical protein
MTAPEDATIAVAVAAVVAAAADASATRAFLVDRKEREGIFLHALFYSRSFFSQCFNGIFAKFVGCDAPTKQWFALETKKIPSKQKTPALGLGSSVFWGPVALLKELPLEEMPPDPYYDYYSCWHHLLLYRIAFSGWAVVETGDVSGLLIICNNLVGLAASKYHILAQACQVRKRLF